MGQKLDDSFWKENPEFLENIKQPVASFDAIQIFELIKENPYTINRNVGMGLDVTISPDMVKICQIGEREGVELYTYKEYFKMYVNLQREQEQKQKEEHDKKAKGTKK